MRTVTVTFDEPLHHVCLMYGLKQTFGKMPFLNRGDITIPPMMRNPDRAPRHMRMRNLVDVSYWRHQISIAYKEEECDRQEITAFTENLILDYLHFRHPFMKVSISGNKCQEVSSGHIVAEFEDKD